MHDSGLGLGVAWDLEYATSKEMWAGWLYLPGLLDGILLRNIVYHAVQTILGRYWKWKVYDLFDMKLTGNSKFLDYVFTVYAPWLLNKS